MPGISPDKEAPARLMGRQVYLIGSGRLQNELIAFFLKRDTGAECLIIEDFSGLPKLDDRGAGLSGLVLAECPEKNRDICLEMPEKLDKAIHYGHMSAIFNVIPGHGIEEKAVVQGVRGIFYKGDPLERFSKGIAAVFDGELWFSREILTRYVMRSREQDNFTGQEESLLTAREIEILTMISAGRKNEDIADKLCISPNTVKTHIYNIFKKIDVPNRLQAALWAVKNL